jgi:hypothetical protein
VSPSEYFSYLVNYPQYRSKTVVITTQKNIFFPKPTRTRGSLMLLEQCKTAFLPLPLLTYLLTYLLYGSLRTLASLIKDVHSSLSLSCHHLLTFIFPRPIPAPSISIFPPPFFFFPSVYSERFYYLTYHYQFLLDILSIPVFFLMSAVMSRTSYIFGNS